MRWFKHMTNASRDEKLVKLVNDWGRAGRDRWWELLELVAEQMGASDRCDLTYPMWKWREIFGFKTVDKTRWFVLALANYGLCTVRETAVKSPTNDDLLMIKIPNLLKIRARQNLIGRKTGHTDIDIEKEREIGSLKFRAKADWHKIRVWLSDSSNGKPLKITETGRNALKAIGGSGHLKMQSTRELSFLEHKFVEAFLALTA